MFPLSLPIGEGQDTDLRQVLQVRIWGIFKLWADWVPSCGPPPETAPAGVWALRGPASHWLHPVTANCREPDLETGAGPVCWPSDPALSPVAALKGSATKDTSKALHRPKHAEGALAFINLGHAYGLDHVERCRRRAETSPV